MKTQTAEVVYNNELTENEVTFLKNMSQSISWDYSVNKWLPYTGKVRGRVISSLTQKGIIVTKKEKGDIDRSHSLTEEAKIDPIVVAIVQPTVVIEEPVEEKLEDPAEEVEGVDVDLVGTWKDGMEPKKFETSIINLLAASYSCKITQVKDSQRNVYIIKGTERNIKMLIGNFQFLTEEIRNEANKQYKESDKTFSKFKFISLFQDEKIGMLSQTQDK